MPLSAAELDDWGQQVDELVALASIYGEDFRLAGAQGVEGWMCGGPGQPGASLSDEGAVEELTSRQPPEGAWALECSIAVQIEPPLGRLMVSLPRQEPEEAGGGASTGGAAGAPDGASDAGAPAATPGSSSASAGASVRFLPPINLMLRLAPGYPSARPPQLLALSALWLLPPQAALLAQQLQRLWDDQGPGLPVCFAWADWLQSSALQHLGCDQVLVLGGSGSSGSDSGGKRLQLGQAAPAEANGSAEGSAGCPSGGSGGVRDSRRPTEEEEEQEEGEGAAEQQKVDGPEQMLFKLLRYDAAREHQEFKRAIHTCSVCFEEQPGTSFVRLDCRHHFCQDCLGEQCRIHVKEGSLEQIKCPEPKCGAALSPQVLRCVLPPTDFERWEQLTLQKTLDRMADAAYCPRCSTVSLEDADNCAQCPKCLFVFCSLCAESWHPGVQCVSAETRLEMLRRKMAGGGALSVQELRRKEQEMLSMAAIEGMSKPCPRCNMAIQKSEGCNKMTCSNCGAFFCYKCNKEIQSYEHFKNGECVLFDEAEILRWEQQWADQVERVAFREARNDFFLQQQLALFAGAGGGGGGREGRGGGGGGRERLQLRGCNCPICGQLCIKMGNNNHMSCWACTSHFCYLCRQALRGKANKHFGPQRCKQHTLD